MKKWTAAAFALLLVILVAIPATGAETHHSNDGFALTLDLHQIINWLATLWFENTPAELPETPAGEQPQAFIEGAGPYIVPVGFEAPTPEKLDQQNDEDENAEAPTP